VPDVRHRVDPGRRAAAALVVAALLAALVAGGFVLRGRPQEVLVPEVVATGTPLPGTSAAPTQPPTEVVVAVAGKVARPGLVRLPAGSRVDDAVRAAGGVAAGADVGLLNLARRLVDGEQVLVGVDPPPGAAPATGPAEAGGPVDLNSATVADLDALPGIGPVLAQRIVDWRTEHGRFTSVEQLREVTGIGESKYADLAAEVTVP
jgi:competence protein ComEA